MAGEQRVRLGLVLAVESIHSKLIILHTRITSYNTDYSKRYASQSTCSVKPREPSTTGVIQTYGLDSVKQ